MMIFKKQIARRDFLKGAGAAVALPWLGAMVPAFGAAAAAEKRATRLAFFTVPNGIMMDQWTPKAEGTNFELSPILQNWAPYRDRFLLIGGLAQNEAKKLEGEIAGEHPRSCASYLTGVHPRMTSGADLQAGVSIDQIAAKELGKNTQLGSLEIGLEPADILGSCESAYSCAYYNTICWSAPATPLPMENRPRAVFERLFGDSDSTDAKERAARIKENRSILDLVSQDVSRLMRKVGKDDTAKLDQYFDAVRSVEKRIQMAEAQAPKDLPKFERPVGIPENFGDYCKLMFDLEILAFQSDMTRVVTFMVGHEMSNRSYPELGFADPHHACTHHQGDPDKIAKVIKVNHYHAKTYRYFLDKMASTPDGDGTLLDKTILWYGGALSDGNMHLFKDLPTLIVAGKDTQLQTNRYIRYPQDTPMTNLFLTLMDKLGMQVDKFGDSTGKLDLLSV